MWMMLTGERVGADKAREWQLVNEVVDPGVLMTRALEVAEKVAALPALAVRVEMEAYRRGMDLSHADALSLIAHFYRMQVFGGGTEGIVPAFMRRGGEPPAS